GSFTQGIWKTTNGGLNWALSNSGLTYTVVQCLAISPSNPNILYAGTDSLGGANSGVYKTTNAGVTWTLTPNTAIQQRGIQAVLVHPTNPNIAWIGVFNAVSNSTDGIYKTTDGGASWVPSSNGMTVKNILSLVVNRLNPNVLYAGSSFNPPSTGPTFVYRSNDGGTTWYSVSNGLPALTTDLNPVRTMSISNVDTSIVLAGLFQNNIAGGAFLTTNGGILWTRRS